MEYVHFSSAEDLGYRLVEEILEYKGRKLLYLISELESPFTPACGEPVEPSEARTIQVKGNILRWKYQSTKENRPVSEIEPIKDKEERREIKEILKSMYKTSKIYFRGDTDWEES